jgi:hypothetical protein
MQSQQTMGCIQAAALSLKKMKRKYEYFLDSLGFCISVISYDFLYLIILMELKNSAITCITRSKKMLI